MENTQELTSAAESPDAALVVHLAQRVEAERRALERELHDEVSGMLAAARMDVSFLKTRAEPSPELREHIDRLDGTLDRAIRATRKIMQALRPALLDHFGLPVALKHHVEETCRGAGRQYRISMPAEFEGVDPQLQIATFRVVQELLAHDALTEGCEVEMFELDDAYRLEIRLLAAATPAAPGPESPNLASLRLWIAALQGQWLVQRSATALVHVMVLPRRT